MKEILPLINVETIIFTKVLQKFKNNWYNIFTIEGKKGVSEEHHDNNFFFLFRITTWSVNKIGLFVVYF